MYINESTPITISTLPVQACLERSSVYYGNFWNNKDIYHKIKEDDYENEDH